MSFLVGHNFHKNLNNALFASALFIAVFIIVAPIFPELKFFVVEESKSVANWFGFVPIESSQSYIPTNHKVKVSPTEKIPEKNMLVVPEIEVNGEIFEGNSIAVLQKGVWHRPRSSTPDLGSNTVLVAHRFLYTSGPNTFYHLDKLKVGDQFTLYWKGKRYDYEVFQTKVVPPTEFSIERPSKDPIVTLYTCTPLFTATDRLVVKAKLIEN